VYWQKPNVPFVRLAKIGLKSAVAKNKKHSCRSVQFSYSVDFSTVGHYTCTQRFGSLAKERKIEAESFGFART